MEIYIRGLASGYEPEHVTRLFFSPRCWRNGGPPAGRTPLRCCGAKNVLYAACA